MEGKMTANNRQSTSGLEDGTDIRTAPRVGRALRCSADSRHRDSEVARGAGSSPRTGTPPVRHKSGHGQPGQSRGEAAPAQNPGRRVRSARAGRATGSATRTLFGCVAAAFVLLAGLLAAVPAQAQTTCNAPSFGGNRQIWAGTVTVAAVSAGSEISAGYGYAVSSAMSSLAPASPYTHNSFKVQGSTVYSIEAVVAQTGDGDLVFAIRGITLSAKEKAALTLYVCDQPYTFSAATESVVASSFTYFKWDVDLDWSSESSRTIYVSLQPNRVATGKPTIRGTATIGSTLTAAKGTIADADGVPAASTFTYQWVRVDGASETDISGATLNTYALSAADVGKKIKVKVGFTDDLTGEEEVLSAATRTVPPGTLPSTPQLRSATVSASTVTLTYDRTLNSSSVPNKAHFTTSVGTVPAPFKCGSGDTAGTDCFSQPANPTITNVTVRGSAVVLTLSAPYPLRHHPRVGEWIPGMYVKYTRRTNTIQSQGGVPTDRSCGQAHIGIPRVSHWRLLGCWHVKGGKNYTGPGMPVTLTSGNLGQLIARKSRIKDLQISGAGSDNRWTNGEDVDITFSFHGNAKAGNADLTSVGAPGWCRDRKAKYESGDTTASLVYRCQIVNGPHRSLYLGPNAFYDGSNTVKISGTITEYSHAYNVHADLRHGAVVKELPPAVPPSLTSAVVTSSGVNIELVFSEILGYPSTEAEFLTFRDTLKSFFAITAAGMPVPVESLAISNDNRRITFTLPTTSTIGQGQSVVVTYTDSTAGDDAVAIQDTLGNDTPTFTTGSGGVPAVTNNSTVDKTGPELTSAVVPSSGVNIELVFSEILGYPSTEAEFLTFRDTLKSFFAITAAGMPVPVESLAISNDNRRITFTLPTTSTISQGQSVVVTYTDSTAGDDAVAIQDTLGNDTPTFTTGSGGVPAVTNNSTATSMQREAPTITGSPALSESGSDGTWTVGETVEGDAHVQRSGDGGHHGRHAEHRARSWRDRIETRAVSAGEWHDGDRLRLHTRRCGWLALVDAGADRQPRLEQRHHPQPGHQRQRGAQSQRGCEGWVDDAWHPGRGRRVHGAIPGTAPEPQRVGRVHLRAAFQRGTRGPELLDGCRRAPGGDRCDHRQGSAPHCRQQPRLGSDRDPEPVGRHRNPVACAGVHRDERGLRGRACACQRGLRNGAGGVPLTASFSGVPAEHDGEAFDVRFRLSEEPATLSFRTVQNGLFNVTGGSIEKASRLNPGQNNGWTLHIDPSGLGDVTVRVIGTTACNTVPGVCTADGRKLAGGLQVTIAGPPTLSVADAEVEENSDATLDFAVTLSRALTETVTVEYGTADGTASAGSGLHKYDRYAQLHRGRGIEDGLGAGARRRARRGLGDDDTQAPEPEPDARQARRRRGDRDHQQTPTRCQGRGSRASVGRSEGRWLMHSQGGSRAEAERTSPWEA